MNKNITKKFYKVFVAMSGGVDSSVAALLLKKQGFDVTGVYMKNWSEESFEGKFSKYCPWRKDLSDVRAVCKKLGIPVKVYNFEKEYNEKVIEYFFRGELAGLTPNPDVVCNREIKFGLFLKKALADGADYIATGHYARLGQKYQITKTKFQIKSKIKNPKNKSFQLRLAKDQNKDQTYFLCLLKQNQLTKTLFPLGDYTKSEVRALAKKAGLKTADKPESMGICFVGEVKLEEFLSARIADSPGDIITPAGEIIGRHRGLPFYTIGQRRALNVSGAIPWYVVGKNLKKNQLIAAAGSRNAKLYHQEVVLGKINWLRAESKKSFSCQARIRHRQPLQSAILKLGKKNIIKFRSPQRAVTPGQFCAIYKQGQLLGGAVIVGTL